MSFVSYAGEVSSDDSRSNTRVINTLATHSINGGAGTVGTSGVVLVDSPAEIYSINNSQNGTIFDVRVLEDNDVQMNLPNVVENGVTFTILLSASKPRALAIGVNPGADILDVFVLRFPFNPLGPAPLPTYIHDTGLSGRSFVDLSPGSVYVFVGKLQITGEGSRWKITGTLMA